MAHKTLVLAGMLVVVVSGLVWSFEPKPSQFQVLLDGLPFSCERPIGATDEKVCVLRNPPAWLVKIFMRNQWMIFEIAGYGPSLEAGFRTAVEFHSRLKKIGLKELGSRHVRLAAHRSADTAGVVMRLHHPSPQVKAEGVSGTKETYNSIGVSTRVLNILEPGEYAPMAETLGFIFKDRKDQYWVVNLEEVKTIRKDNRYLVLILHGECARGMPQFDYVPKRCVKEERWEVYPKIKSLLKKQLLKKEYEYLYRRLEGYLVKKP